MTSTTEEILYDGHSDPVVPNKLVLRNNSNSGRIDDHTYNTSMYTITNCFVFFEFLYSKRMAMYCKKKNELIYEIYPFNSDFFVPFNECTIVTRGDDTFVIRPLKNHNSSYIEHYEDYTRRSWSMVYNNNDNIPLIVYKFFKDNHMTYNPKKIKYPKMIGRKIIAKPLKMVDNYWDITFY